MAQSAFQFDEIQNLIQGMEHPSCSAKRDLPKMDHINRIKYWLNFAADRQVAAIQRPRLSIYAAAHGFCFDDMSQITHYKNMVAALLAGEHAVNEVINLANADLRLYDLNMDQASADLTKGEAMSEEALLNSLAYGLMTVEPDNDLLSISAIGPGSEAHGLSVCAGFIDDMKAPLDVKFKDVNVDNIFALLQKQSGYELNAIIGAILAARLAHIPVILEGYSAMAALMILDHLNPNCHWHCALALPENKILSEFAKAKDWLILPDARPYGLGQGAEITGGMHIAALRQMLILDDYYQDSADVKEIAQA